MGKKHLVLIVDDEPNNLQLMKQILKNSYSLAFAVSGEQALVAVEKLSPDCILLDIMMPGMDGFETCRRLKDNINTRDIPVIFVTAKDQVEDEAGGLELGAVDYLTKPIQPVIIHARIKNQLALKAAREQILEKNKQLEEQNKELIKAAQLKEDVDRITRHDLKTPLNSIINLPRLMFTDKSLAPEYIDFLKSIEKSGFKMLDMINRSLDIFKMERKTYKLCTEMIDIIKIINRILEEHHIFIESKELNSIIKINGENVNNKKDFYIYGEKMLCYSMLANLLKNAFEASPENKDIVIDISGQDKSVIISIHNSGEVPLEIRDKFFDKYATHGKKSGTGLGTYSAKLIAETHEGTIELDSSNKGQTIVKVILPLDLNVQNLLL